MGSSTHTPQTAHHNIISPVSEGWQQSLRDCVTQLDTLCELLNLDKASLIDNYPHLTHFHLKVTRSFIARMRPGDLGDPLLLQILPQAAENQSVAGFVPDPLHEQASNALPGLLHKYRSRVLLTLTGVCAIHCRFCFRREFPYADNNPGRAGWEQALQYIAADPNICEVILSGGDPLMVKDTTLGDFIARLSDIPHIRYLRLHTRLPIVLPDRLTPRLTETLTNTRLKPVVVIHCNHPQEINDEVIQAIAPLRAAGITLFNQGVLLAGINDEVSTLVALSHRLFEAGVMPYYLHLLDQVCGTAHFQIPRAHAIELMRELACWLPGYLLPRLVEERPGQNSKTPVQWA